MKKLNINAIRIDGGTQARVEIDNDVVGDYAEAAKLGVEFPPIVVFFDGADHWLADGFHRYHSHKQAGKASILAEVREGTVRDAILFSLGANCTHGLRRTNADKRKAVQTLLADPEWRTWSDRKIAEVAGVTHPFVAGIRAPKVVTVTTSKAPAPPTRGQTLDPKEPTSNVPKVVTVTTPKPEELEEAREAVSILAEENERLNDRLAVEAMDASEEEKGKAAATIAELRAELKTVTAELKAVKSSRDIFMRDNAELKKTVERLQKKLRKLEVAA